MTKLVGVLNYNNISFSDGGRFSTPQAAAEGAAQMLQEGADIVDIGITSTSYGAKLLSQEEEWEKLEALLNLCTEYEISVDTFYPENALRSIMLGASMINDVSGGKDPRMLEIIANNPSIKYVLMQSLVLPADKKVRVKDISEIYSFGERKIEECLRYGIQKAQIIFDPGIGFTTNPEQSLELIANIKHYKRLGVPIYVGHSRKSFLQELTYYPPEQRDIETTAASIYLMLENVDYLRVHNVHMHKRALSVIEAILKHKIN